LDYIEKVEMEKIRQHAEDFIEKRLAPENPLNDGRQTPFTGHPVFKAQHATATCCRSCLLKWHSIPKEISLTEEECRKIVDILIDWIVWRKNFAHAAQTNVKASDITKSQFSAAFSQLF